MLLPNLISLVFITLFWTTGLTAPQSTILTGFVLYLRGLYIATYNIRPGGRA